MDYHSFLALLLVLFIKSLTLADYCSINDCSPKTYEVHVARPRVASNDPFQDLIVIGEKEVESDNKCWKYTWLGAISDTTNETTSCDSSPDAADIPCFAPIVWTNGTNKFNQPNLTDLREQCEQGHSLENLVSSYPTFK